MSGEFELIDRLSGWFTTSEDVEIGIGDDAAVLQAGIADVVTTDTLVENVHFRRDWCSPADVGWKLAAANLSDVAAMGARPSAFVLSLALPSELDVEWVEEFCAGINEAVETMVPRPGAVSAAGGDLSSTGGPAVVTMTLLGQVAPADPVVRHGASPGDRIAISGTPGMSAAGLAVLESGTVAPERFPELVAAYRRPTAEVESGRLLGREQIPSAMIDVSDGLIQDLGHVLAASDVGAHIDLTSLPIPSPIQAGAGTGLGRLIDWVGAGGEDFCLLATIPSGCVGRLEETFEDDRHRWYFIGEVAAPERGLEVVGPEGESIEEFRGGFRHFEES